MVVITEIKNTKDGPVKIFHLDETYFNKIIDNEWEIKQLTIHLNFIRGHLESLEKVLGPTIQTEIETQLYYLSRKLSPNRSYRGGAIISLLPTHFSFVSRKWDALKRLVECGVFSHNRGWYKRLNL